mmetsp:Transcript_1675/g.4713  ORF Transcript_1675/g.4713 Transcript_1675/m.4713 type:complete len:451 (+) Transcript_1675:31-1383(+)
MDIANLGSLITTGSSLITSGSTKLLDGIKAGAEMLSFRPQFIDVGDLKLVTTSLVAEGGYSFVYTAREVMPGSEQGRLFALKKVIAQEAEVLEIARVEMNLLRTLPRHPNIIDYHGSTLENKGRGVTEMYMALEYCANGSLVDLVMPGMPSLSEEKLLSVFHPVCKAVAHLHAQNPPITHRDLKLENVLCSSSGVYKLCDFGSATTRRVKIKTSAERQREAETISKFSTLMYRAPEMVDLYQGHEISEKVDVWALGCILYTLAFHKHPFDAGTELQIINARFNIPQSSPYGEEVHNLMRYALQPDPAKRPTVEELIAKVAQRRGVGMDAEINLADSHQLPRARGLGSGDKPSRARGREILYPLAIFEAEVSEPCARCACSPVTHTVPTPCGPAYLVNFVHLNRRCGAGLQARQRRLCLGIRRHAPRAHRQHRLCVRLREHASGFLLFRRC